MAGSTRKFSGAPSAVIVAGNRTPFVKAFGPYIKMDTIALGTAAAKGLLERTGIDKSEIDAVVWGGVILPTTAPNIAREVTFELGLPNDSEAFTVTRACASGLQALTSAATMIERGEADVVMVGGSESTSNTGVSLPAEVIHAVAPLAFGKAGGPKAIMQVLKDLYPFNNILPKRPQIAERSTGELMGESAEKMAEINKISRSSQDELTLRSHQNAAAAYDKGYFDAEISAVKTPDGEVVERDGLLRGNTTLEKLSSLGAAFKEGGTLSAGNSTALTDGAAALLVMHEDKARALGYTPLARVKSWAYVGVDPADQLLIGPAIAMPLAAQRAGLELKDFDLIDMHEAFAAQVLSVLKMMESAKFCKERLGMKKAFGKIDFDKFNVNGSSLALGHPFGATGVRMATTMAHELHRSGKNTALLGICAAGGLGAGAVLERVE